MSVCLCVSVCVCVCLWFVNMHLYFFFVTAYLEFEHSTPNLPSSTLPSPLSFFSLSLFLSLSALLPLRKTHFELAPNQEEWMRCDAYNHLHTILNIFRQAYACFCAHSELLWGFLLIFRSIFYIPLSFSIRRMTVTRDLEGAHGLDSLQRFLHGKSREPMPPACVFVLFARLG